MAFTGFLAYAAWQDGRSGLISTVTIAGMLATSIGTTTSPVAALAPLLTGVPWIWLYRSGSLGAADPPAAVAIVFRHGIPVGLVALGLACLTTSAACLCGHYHRAPHRVPLFPGLLVAHLLVMGSGLL